MDKCTDCHRTIYEESPGNWAFREDVRDGQGRLTSRYYTYGCASAPRGAHVPASHDEDDASWNALVPVAVGKENIPSAETVLTAYANLAQHLNNTNPALDPSDRASVPFAIQQVLADYIEERRVIQSIRHGIDHT